jgi:SEC-C motif
MLEFERLIREVCQIISVSINKVAAKHAMRNNTITFYFELSPKMTLILSLVTSSTVTMLADRRITSEGKTLDDYYNKLCVFCCHDARVVLAFTGIATFHGFDTSYWLMQELSALNAPEFGRIYNILEAVRGKIGATLTALGLSNELLTIVVGGFWYEDGGASHPLSCTVTNVSSDGSIVPDFSIEFHDTSAGSSVFLAGAVTAVSHETLDHLRDLTSRSLPRTSLIRKAVGIMQDAAGAGSSFSTIGEHSVSASVKAAVNTPIVCTYHAPSGTRLAFGPNAVLPGIWVEGPEIMSATLLAGPSLHKNQRCWCGSGRKFKHCHLAKFGSVYAEFPGFTAPMSWVCQTGFDNMTPAGTEFIVTGHFE